MISQTTDLATVTADGVLPVIVIERTDQAAPLADALAQGGLHCAEVTLRTDAALEAITRIAADRRLVVGAGTVTTPEQAADAVAAGARFVVSPGLDADILERCRQLDVPAIPGVATATEIMAALRCGASTLKLFPAAVVGGVGAVRALSAPFPHARFVPTGGIGVDDVGSYLRLPSVAAVGGSWIAPADLLRRGDYREIAGRAAQAATAARRAREGGRA